jgi:hypothetical protein
MNVFFKMINTAAMGLLFIMFLPAIGFILTGVALVKWMWSRLRPAPTTLPCSHSHPL